jgi:hypothetical protein
LDVPVEFWMEIIQSILGLIVPSLFVSCGSHDKFVLQLILNYFQTVFGVFDVVVFTEVWHVIINIVIERLHLVFELGAAG